jgi:hypothetical protein
MPVGANIADNIASYVQTIHEMAVLAARDIDFITNLVMRFDDNRGTASRTRSEYGTVAFQPISDSDDLTSQAFTPSVANTLTPMMYGAQFFITDRRLRTAPWEEAGIAARELGEGAAKQVSRNLLSVFNQFTGGTVGSAGGTLTWGNIFAAVTKLQQQNARPPFFGVLQTGHWYHLGTATVPAGAQTNAPDFQDRVMQQFFVGSFFNTLWFVTNDIPSGTAAVGGVFAREALAYDERLPFNIRSERDESRGGGGIELNATMEYAYGVWRPAFGVAIVGTSVVP